MARAHDKGEKAAAALRGRTKRVPAGARRRLATSEARADFSNLVNELGERDTPGESLADNAIEIGPHRKGGAWLVPEVDARAAVEELEELRDELENITIGFLLQDRLADSNETVPAADVIRDLGFGELLDELPE